MSKLRCYDRNNGRAKIIQLVKYSREQRKLTATGTDDLSPKHLMLYQLLAEHYNQASSYIDRLQVHLSHGTARKILAITERLWEI